MDYEIVVGPPALPYPEQESVPPPATRRRLRRLANILAILGAALAILAIAALTVTNYSPNTVGTTDVSPDDRPSIVPVEPAPVKWVIPDIPDADIASVDTRYVAVLARHNVGPGVGHTNEMLVANAHRICNVIAAGFTAQQVEDVLLDPSQNNSLTPLQAKVITVAAVDLYCPN